MYLYDNMITGEIPSEIGNLTNLERLKLHENLLTGEIPETLCNLSDLTWSQEDSSYYVSTLFDNQLCPPYPSCIEDYMGFQYCLPIITLLAPENDAIISITPDNISDTLWFEWAASTTDVDGDSLSYLFDVSSEMTFLETMIQSDLGSDSVAWVEYSVLAEAIDSLNVVTGAWIIAVTDGIDSVVASNGPYSLTIDATSMAIEPELIPEVFALHQNYPNPFNPVTTLRYDLPEDALVNITIYDMMGRVVKTMVNSQQNTGYKSVRWNSTNDKGSPVSAGLYLYTIQAGEFRQTKKMVLLK